MADRSERGLSSPTPNSSTSMTPEASTSTEPRRSPYEPAAMNLVRETALINRSFTPVQHPTSQILQRHVFELQEALHDVNRFDSTGDKRERRQDPQARRAEETQRDISTDLATVLGKVGLEDGERLFQVDVAQHQETSTDGVEMTHGPLNAPTITTSVDMTLEELLPLLFKTDALLESDLDALLQVNPSLGELLGGGPESVIPANTTIAIGGTPLGYIVQRVAALAHVTAINQSLSQSDSGVDRSESRIALGTVNAYRSLLERESTMLHLQRSIDQISLKLEQSSTVTPGNAAALQEIIEHDLGEYTKTLIAARERARELERSLTDSLRDLRAITPSDAGQHALRIEEIEREVQEVRRYTSALAGETSQGSVDRIAHRSPVSAFAEVAMSAERRVHEYAASVKSQLEEPTPVTATSSSAIPREHTAQLAAEQQAATNVATSASSSVSRLLQSLADPASGTAVGDQRSLLTQAASILAVQAERQSSQSGHSQDGMVEAAERYEEAGALLQRCSDLPGLTTADREQLTRASIDMQVRSREYGAASTQETDAAVRELGHALSLLTTGSHADSRAFSFLDTSRRADVTLDDTGEEFKGFSSTKLGGLDEREATRLGRLIADLPEDKRARAMELLTQIADRHATRYEQMSRDSSVIDSCAATFRAHQVADEVARLSTSPAPDTSGERRRLVELVRSGALSQGDARARLEDIESLSSVPTYDRASRIAAHTIHARFLMAYNTADEVGDRVEHSLEAIRAEIRAIEKRPALNTAKLQQELATSESATATTASKERAAELQRQIIDEENREIRDRALSDRTDAFMMRAYSSLAANGASSDRERYAEYAVRVATDARARDAAILSTTTSRNDAAKRQVEARHADLMYQSVEALGLAGRHDRAKEVLEELKVNYHGVMSEDVRRNIQRIDEIHRQGNSFTAALNAAINEAQNNGTMVQSIGLGVTGAAVGTLVLPVPVIGTAIGGAVGFLADKGINAIRGSSRISAAYQSGISGLDTSQALLNVATLGVDALTVFLPFKGAGKVVGSVGLKGATVGALSSQTKIALSQKLDTALTKAGVAATAQLSERQVSSVARNLVHHEVMSAMSRHGGAIVALQTGTMGGLYAYSRHSITSNSSLSTEEREAALRALNHDTLLHAGAMAAMVGGTIAVGTYTNRAPRTTTEKALGVRNMDVVERGTAQEVISKWIDDDVRGATGLRRQTPPAPLSAEESRPVESQSSERVAQDRGDQQPPQASEATPASRAENDISTPSLVEDNLTVNDPKVFGKDAAQALTEIGKDPHLQEGFQKEARARLFERFSSRGQSIDEYYLYQSEIDAARRGKLAPNADLQPSDGASGADGSGGGRGPSRPAGPDSDGPGSVRESDGDVAEFELSSEWQADSFQAERRYGEIRNALGGSETDGGGTAVLERPMSETPRVRRPATRPVVETPEATAVDLPPVTKQGGVIIEGTRATPAEVVTPPSVPPLSESVGVTAQPTISPTREPLPSTSGTASAQPQQPRATIVAPPQFAHDAGSANGEADHKAIRHHELNTPTNVHVDVAPTAPQPAIEITPGRDTIERTPTSPVIPRPAVAPELEPPSQAPEVGSLPQESFDDEPDAASQAALDDVSLPKTTPQASITTSPHTPVAPLPEPAPTRAQSKVAQQVRDEDEEEEEDGFVSPEEIDEEEETPRAATRRRIEEPVEKKTDRQRRRSGKRVVKKVVSGMFSSTTIEEHQTLEDNKDIFAVGTIRSNQGSEE